MTIDISKGKSVSVRSSDHLTLPDLPESLNSLLVGGNTMRIDGTNVVRVPFGVRQPRRQRPERPERWATLVIPIQPKDNPTPPPQAA